MTEICRKPRAHPSLDVAPSLAFLLTPSNASLRLDAGEPDDGAGFGGGGGFQAHFPDDTNNSFHQLHVGGEHALLIIKIVFKSDADMAA